MASKETTLNFSLVLVIIGAVFFAVYKFTGFFSTGGAGANFFTNAFGGSLSNSQEQAIASNEQQQIIVAGGNPITAAPIAQSDTQKAVSGQPTTYGQALATFVLNPFQTLDSVFSGW